MHRVICTFVVCIWHKQVFSWRDSNDIDFNSCNMPSFSWFFGKHDIVVCMHLFIFTHPTSNKGVMLTKTSWCLFLLFLCKTYFLGSQYNPLSKAILMECKNLKSSDVQTIAVISVMFLNFQTDRSEQTSVDPDETAPSGRRGAVWSGSTLFSIPSASFGCISLWKIHTSQILGLLQYIVRVSGFLGVLRYP